MDTLTLEAVLRRDPFASKKFLGCFPSDELPVPTRIPSTCCFIVNLDKGNQPGSHWFSVFVRPRVIYVFDSFGLYPKVIRGWCSAARRDVCYNSTAHQSLDEVTCGGYSVYSLCELARGRSFSAVINKFRSTHFDDAFIRRYLQQVHGVLIPQTMQF